MTAFTTISDKSFNETEEERKHILKNIADKIYGSKECTVAVLFLTRNLGTFGNIKRSTYSYISEIKEIETVYKNCIYQVRDNKAHREKVIEEQL